MTTDPRIVQAFKDKSQSNFLNTKQEKYQSFSGTDIQAVMYLPLITRGTVIAPNAPKFKLFAELQTISISTTRSVSPVRVLGRSNAVTYTRGARTIAGTMVFATINSDAFEDIYDIGMAESSFNSSSSTLSDQLPPFSVVIVGANESGAVAIQALHGITLTNYGTTYSIQDLYTETTYTYVAEDMVPLTTDSNAARRILTDNIVTSVKTLTNEISESLGKAYAKTANIASSFAASYLNTLKKRGETARDISTPNNSIVFP